MSAPTPNIISIPTSPNGMAETSWFSLVSRRKLQSQAANGDRVRDNRSLRRFVLLKNSITSATATFDVAPPSSSSSEPLYPEPESQLDVDDDEEEEEEEDVFVFPDVCSFPDPSSPPQAGDEEARWLDSLLEDLEDDEPDPDVDVATVDVDDEDDYDSYLDESDLSSLFDGFSSTSGSLSLSSESASPTIAHPSCAIPPSPSPTTTTLPLSPQFYPLPEGPDDFDLDSEPPELLGRSTEEDEDSDADSSDWPFVLTPSFGRSTSSLSLSLTAQEREQREREAAGATTVDFVEEHSYFHPLDFDYIHPNHLVSPPVAAARYRSGVSC